MGLGSCDNSIVDHCSIAWGTDEGFSSRGAHSITFQRNIIAESLNESVHYNANDRTQKERHAFAASVSGSVGSFHHNLLVNCTDRNWSLAGGLEADGKSLGGALDITNNVVYNWWMRTTDGGVGRLNFVGNYYKMGAVSNDMAILQLNDDKLCDTPMQIYVSGNKVTDSKGNAKLSPSQDAWNTKYIQTYVKTAAEQRVNQPLYPNYVNTQSADDAYASVLSNVGANARGLDYLDQRYLNEVKSGTYTYTGSVDKLKGIIDSQNDAGGYPTSAKFKGGKAPADTDRDGISDEWEAAHGLDPSSAADGNLTTLSTEGYTNIELYLNKLAGDSVQIEEHPIVIEPLNGTLIQALEIKDTANYKSWQIEENAAVGSMVFGDRDVTYTALPAALTGAEFIQTACDSKNSGSDLAAFTAGADITAYLLVDSRVTAEPAWRSGWTKTGLTAENNKGVTFEIYSQNFAAGETVTLGANGQSTGCVNYAVFVTEQQGIIGDVNADGAFGTADIVMLQKWLLTDDTLTDWKAGDLDGNGRINAADLTLMKRMAMK